MAESTGRRDDFTGRVIASAIELHRRLGPGLAESPYPSARWQNLLLYCLRASMAGFL
ncbi:MAG: hypothetical protein HRJ53_22345 [Acidobacteria bacterium Pan2503]|uniref:GxxExxY protein n=1 Tax=Candidatus Acidiferrum panamense TaxID=2741543 RepID=A0A7V8SYU1_9BACT|nr:hypothetical protein [Candidatus Acidoferrum panamensis]